MSELDDLFVKAQSHHQQGRLVEAADGYRRILSRHASHGGALHFLGVVAYQQGNLQEALVLMQDSLRMEPGQAPYMINLALVHEALGQIPQAMEHYERALSTSTANLPVLTHLLDMVFKAGDSARAERLVTRGIQAMPDWSDGYRMLGDIKYGAGAPEAAVNLYEQALKLVPDNTQALNNLSHVFMEHYKRFDQAEPLLRRAVEINPAYQTYWRNLGLVLENLNRLEEAVACYERVLQLDAGNEKVRDWLQAARAGLAAEQGARRAVSAVTSISREWLARTPRLLQQTSGFTYVIEVVDTCNLRCPTCPRGNMPSTERPRGFMKLELFQRIVDKICNESRGGMPILWLFNWGEPLLHPELPAMVRYAREKGCYCMLSSNLNIKRDLREVLLARPHEIKISLSGSSQEIYGRSHVRGKVELVKANLVKLRELENELNTGTKIWVSYHLYRDNLQELEPMGTFVQELGFKFMTIPSLFQPFEKLIELLEGKLSQSELHFVETMIPYDPRKLLEIKRKYFDPKGDCEARYGMMSIAHDGSVDLCCGVYRMENKLGLNFLEAGHDQLQQAKYRHHFCGPCFSHGVALQPMSGEAEAEMARYQDEALGNIMNQPWVAS